MSNPTRTQLEALTILLHQLRKDWDVPGIRAALARASALTTAADLAVAACRVAANPDAHTPGLIPQPGQHWQATTTGQRAAPIMCAEHPTQSGRHCPDCHAQAVPKPDYVVVPKRAGRTSKDLAEWVP